MATANRKMAIKRLQKEFNELTVHPADGIVAGPISEANMFEWEAMMVGPEGTCYDGGCFHATISFPNDYPLSPPKMRFTSEMWHPNVHEDGKVCISILHTTGDAITATYEDASEQWSPVQSLEKVLLSVVSMLAEPNDESPANIDAAKQWRTDRKGFMQRVQSTVRKSLYFE